jgi:hypothetical protein
LLQTLIWDESPLTIEYLLEIKTYHPIKTASETAKLAQVIPYLELGFSLIDFMLMAQV